MDIVLDTCQYLGNIDIAVPVASKRFQHQYPNRQQPNRQIFQRLYGRLGETVSFQLQSHVGRPKTITV